MKVRDRHKTLINNEIYYYLISITICICAIVIPPYGSDEQNLESYYGKSVAIQYQVINVKETKQVTDNSDITQISEIQTIETTMTQTTTEESTSTIETTIETIVATTVATTEATTTTPIIETSIGQAKPLCTGTFVKINAIVDNWSDEQLLAHIISAEAGNCGLDECLRVGTVIANRVQSKYFPSTIREVVFAPNQYSPTWNGRIYDEPTPDAITASKLILQGKRTLPCNVLFQTNNILNYQLYMISPWGLNYYTYGNGE